MDITMQAVFKTQHARRVCLSFVAPLGTPPAGQEIPETRQAVLSVRPATRQKTSDC